MKVLFLETVGNGPTLPIVDLEKLLSLPILKQINPLIILDNTLPTNTSIPLAKIIQKSNLKIIGLESATKFYLFNQDLGGILFTYHEDLQQCLLTKRKRIGATPGPSLIGAFRTLLPEKKIFDERNSKIMYNTKLLSQICSEVKGSGVHFSISYPPEKIPLSPVFFLQPLAKSKLSSEALFYRLEKFGAFANLLIIESFGFHQTAVMHSPRYGGYLRFAGGTESRKEIEQIGRQLQQAFAQIY